MDFRFCTFHAVARIKARAAVVGAGGLAPDEGGHDHGPGYPHGKSRHSSTTDRNEKASEAAAAASLALPRRYAATLPTTECPM